MPPTLELRQVQKATPKGASGRVHLAVPGAAGAAARTLCNKLFDAGDYREVDGEADCQLCQKRRSDPALVSSAYFEGDMGSHLLELSLAQAKAGRSKRQAGRAPASSSTKTEDTGQDRPDRSDGRRRPPAKSRPDLKVVPEPESPARIGDLELAGLQKTSDNVYRSPAGVVIRTRRRGDDWEVAEVVFDGAVQVKRDGDGKIRMKVGDVAIDYSAMAGRFRAVHRKEPSG